MKCKNGKCEIMNKNACCKVCDRLILCEEEWSKDCQGLEHDDYCLCTNFDSVKCELEITN